MDMKGREREGGEQRDREREMCVIGERESEKGG